MRAVLFRSSAMKKAAFVAWLILRATRWLCYIGLLAYAYAVTLDRPSFVNYFGHPLLSTEAWLFGLGMGALFAGFLELMMREKAGIAKVGFFRLMPPAAPPQSK
jgi:hypothetical protein